MLTLPDHHLGADLQQQCHLLEIPTASLSFMSLFFLFSSQMQRCHEKILLLPVLWMPRSLESSAEQLLLLVNILENIHFRQKMPSLFQSISKEKKFLFLAHLPLFSLPHKQVLQRGNCNKNPSLEKQNKFCSYCKDLKRKKACTLNNKQIKVVNKTY